MTSSESSLLESIAISQAIDQSTIESCTSGPAEVRRQGGRLFIMGVGGSAGHASHAVNDLRMFSGFKAHAPTDNVSELTAHTNNEGWGRSFASWLEGSKPRSPDRLLVFSAGGEVEGEKRLGTHRLGA